MTSSSGGLRKQGAWAVVDQVLSSGTNFVPSLLLARVLGPGRYGTFSLAFLAWFGVLAVVRSALMEPYTLAAAAAEGETWREITKNASGSVVLAGTFAGAVFAIVGGIIGPSTDHGRVFLVIGLLAPGLALQEFWRIASFASSRARTAAANDACWAVGLIIAFGILLPSASVTAPECLFAWGIGAWIAAALGVAQLGVIPRIDRAAVKWARKWGRVGAWFTLTSATFAAGSFAAAAIISAKLGSAALGLFRIVQTLFGPVQLLTTAVESVFMPHLVRVVKKTDSNGMQLAVRSSLLMSGLVTVYGLVLLVAAHTVLVDLFGVAFAGAGALVLPLLISYAIDAAAFGAAAHLQVRALGSRISVAQFFATATRIGAVALLATIGGVRDAVWGLVIASTVGAVALWIQVGLTRHVGPREDDDTEIVLDRGALA